MIAKLERVLCLSILVQNTKGQAKIDQKSKMGYALTYGENVANKLFISRYFNPLRSCTLATN